MPRKGGVEVFAPAKINLTLHVTGQRVDGYHLLDSLVVFAQMGDSVIVRPADQLSLTVSGPQAASVPTGDGNLVLRAARLLGGAEGAEIELIKRLPVSSGIGGGSSDAAAAIRALCRLWSRNHPTDKQLLSLGADVPVCMDPGTWRMRGIGDDLIPVAKAFPDYFGLVLINPRVSVSTPDIFKALKCKANPPMADALPDFGTAEKLGEWLVNQRNDLEAPAIECAPVIADVLSELRSHNPLCARMSGSGATCFALISTEYEAKAIGSLLAEQHPDWWVSWGGKYSVSYHQDRLDQLIRATT